MPAEGVNVKRFYFACFPLRIRLWLDLSQPVMYGYRRYYNYSGSLRDSLPNWRKVQCAELLWQRGWFHASGEVLGEDGEG